MPLGFLRIPMEKKRLMEAYKETFEPIFGKKTNNNTMKYKALKDVPYWGIKAGEVYKENIDEHIFNEGNILTIKPLLEAGIIEEYKSREPLTKENIKLDEGYLSLFLSSEGNRLSSQWDDFDVDHNRANAPIFRPDEEKVATDCYKAMCDFGFEWVKENYSKYH